MARKSKADGRGGIQVLRIKTHPRLGGGLLEHDSGRVRPDNVREVPEGEATVVPHTTLVNEVRAKFALQAALERRLEDARRAGRRAGRMPHHAVEFVFQGAGRYGSGYEWTRQREAAFERACREWVRDVLGPDSVIAVVCAHRDELTHHLHVLAIPIHEGKLGWCAVRDASLERIEERQVREAAERDEPLPKRRKGSRRYALLQDDFHARVGREFGLDRGERSSGRRHEAIDRAVSAEIREQQAVARIDQAVADRRRLVDESETQARGDFLEWVTGQDDRLDVREFAATVQQRDLDGRERVVTDREQGAEKREVAATAQQRDLDGRELVVTDREQGAEKREVAATAQQRDLDGRELVVTDREQGAEKREVAATAQQRDLDGRELVVTDREQGAEKREVAATAQQRDLDGRELVVTDREQGAEKREVAATAQQRDLDGRIREAGDLSSAVERLTTQLASLRVEWDSLLARVERARSQLEEHWQDSDLHGLWVRAAVSMRRGLRGSAWGKAHEETASELANLLDPRDVGEPRFLRRRVEALERRYPDPSDPASQPDRER